MTEQNWIQRLLRPRPSPPPTPGEELRRALVRADRELYHPLRLALHKPERSDAVAAVLRRRSAAPLEHLGTGHFKVVLRLGSEVVRIETVNRRRPKIRWHAAPAEYLRPHAVRHVRVSGKRLRLEFMDPVTPMAENDPAFLPLKRDLRARGYRWRDAAPKNAGRTADKRIVVFDGSF